jgi:hypothetical protein
MRECGVKMEPMGMYRPPEWRMSSREGMESKLLRVYSGFLESAGKIDWLGLVPEGLYLFDQGLSGVGQIGF